MPKKFAKARSKAKEAKKSSVLAAPPQQEPTEISERFLIEELVAARQRHDFSTTIDRAELLRDRFPGAELGYRFGALALREKNRLEEAGTVLAAASAKFAEKAWLLSEHLFLAQKRGDWKDVAERARAFRERFPDGLLGWQSGFNALLKLDCNEEADHLLVEVEAVFGKTGEQFAGREWLLAVATAAAARRGAWQEASERAANLREVFPSNDQGWIVGLRSLRLTKRLTEAQALLKEAEAAHQDKIWMWQEAAALLQATGKTAEAAQQWRRVREALPDQQSGYIGGFQTSLTLGLFEEAEALLREAERRFPPAPLLMSQAATLAQRRGDDREAARYWEAMLAAYPDNEDAYRGCYQICRRLSKFDEADAVLREALDRWPASRWALTEAALLAQARFDFSEADRRWVVAATLLPNDPDIALKHAMILSVHYQHADRDWPTTMARLQALHHKFPEHVPSWRSHIYALRAQGASREAELLAEKRIQDNPNEPDLWLEFAFTAADQDAPEQASERLAEAAKRFPDHPNIQNQFALSLARVLRLDEADRQYQQGLERFPDSADLACGYAAVAASRQDWPEALRRWTKARERFPTDGRTTRGLLDAHAALADDSVTPLIQTADGVLPRQSDRAQMYEQFQSLGGTGQGCEFGIVQRMVGGVEPLGLLRWTAIHPKSLVEALESRFEGVGTPEQTLITYFGAGEAGNPEYCYSDKRFATRMHTFIHKKDMPEDTMFKQTCRRMAFLRRKLIQDLTDGEKVFVYKIYERNLEPEELARLHRAMQSYGDNTFLYVRYADEQQPSGTVVQMDDGLLVGYISGFNTRPDGQLRAPDVSAWNSICKGALALHASRRQTDFGKPQTLMTG